MIKSKIIKQTQSGSWDVFSLSRNFTNHPSVQHHCQVIEVLLSIHKMSFTDPGGKKKL